jgi:hypothetical protein
MLFQFTLQQLQDLLNIEDVNESRVPLVTAGSIVSVAVSAIAICLRLVAHRVNGTRLLAVSRTTLEGLH